MLFLNLIVAAWTLWAALKIVSHCLTPVAVVSSGSMRPTLRKGDLVLVHGYYDIYDVGDIILFEINGLQIPFVHRILEVRQSSHKSSISYLTKGDNNEQSDRMYYGNDTLWLESPKVIGKVYAFFPYAGQFSLLISEFPALRILLFLLIGVLFLVSQNGLH